MKITHPIPATTRVSFKPSGYNGKLVDGVVRRAILLGTRTWTYVVEVEGKDWSVVGSQVVSESGRPKPREDGWDEFP